MEVCSTNTLMNISSVRMEPETKAAFCKDKCDRYDYLAAVGCGVMSGLVDIFLVGMPNVKTTKTNSILGNWTDAQADKAVEAFAKSLGWKGNGTGSAIGFLERRFPVNYDQGKGKDAGDLLKMRTQNHHMKSLGHSPDIVGLFFSLLSQFTGASVFLDSETGKLVFYPAGTQELQGRTFIEKLFYGTANWFGHLVSDFAGSSGGRNSTSGRGSGIVIPFYELFGLCNFGSFRVKGPDKKVYENTVATLATKVFEQGYDARWGLTMAIPVVLCDLSIKLIWAIRHYFCDQWPLTVCIPTRKQDDLRVMLIVGDATLCLMDGADAAIRSGGDALTFCLHLNLIAWYRFVTLVIREVCIRLGVGNTVAEQLEAYRQVNAELERELTQLKQLDTERFHQETERYQVALAGMQNARTERELTRVLERELVQMGSEKPYQGNFEDFMQDPNAVLRFR